MQRMASGGNKGGSGKKPKQRSGSITQSLGSKGSGGGGVGGGDDRKSLNHNGVDSGDPLDAIMQKSVSYVICLCVCVCDPRVSLCL
jgi:hypothetical protein